MLRVAGAVSCLDVSYVIWLGASQGHDPLRCLEQGVVVADRIQGVVLHNRNPRILLGSEAPSITKEMFARIVPESCGSTIRGRPFIDLRRPRRADGVNVLVRFGPELPSPRNPSLPEPHWPGSTDFHFCCRFQPAEKAKNGSKTGQTGTRTWHRS